MSHIEFLHEAFHLICLWIRGDAKKSLNEQGWNSIHKQSKWKASWRNFIWLIAFGTLYGIFLYLFTVEHNLLNALNVEANSDFYLKFYFFGIFVNKNGQKNQSTKSICTHLVDFMM